MIPIGAAEPESPGGHGPPVIAVEPSRRIVGRAHRIELFPDEHELEYANYVSSMPFPDGHELVSIRK